MSENLRYDKVKADRTLEMYNMVPNLLWSTMGLAPITVYCYNWLDRSTFLIFLSFSAIPMFMTNARIDRLRLGRSVRFYRKLGVPTVNKVAQHGVIIMNLMRRKYAGYKVLTNDATSIRRLLGRTYMFEKFHWMSFLFFILTTGHAALNGRWVWAFVLCLTNVFYNIYPNLLQRYIRLRLSRYAENHQ